MAYLTARPAAGNITQGFGPRPKPTPTSPAIHYGVDYGWGRGDAIYAARAGTVRSYSFSGAYGKRLIIDHGEGRETWYCHTSSSTVTVGDTVASGAQVAWMGATGNVVGKHLHFELRINGVATDPAQYFTATAGNGTTPIGDTFMAALNDEQQAELLAAVRDLRTQVLGAGGFSPSLAGRIINLDRQVTGADKFTPNLVGHVLDLKASGGVDVEVLAASIVAKLPEGGPTAEQVVDAFVSRLGAR